MYKGRHIKNVFKKFFLNCSHWIMRSFFFLFKPVIKTYSYLFIIASINILKLERYALFYSIDYRSWYFSVLPPLQENVFTGREIRLRLRLSSSPTILILWTLAVLSLSSSNVFEGKIINLLLKIIYLHDISIVVVDWFCLRTMHYKENLFFVRLTRICNFLTTEGFTSIRLHFSAFIIFFFLRPHVECRVAYIHNKSLQ